MKTIIIQDYFIAKTFFEKFSGYMLRKKPHKKIIIFLNTSSIHTYFMKFDLDIIFTDENYKVVGVHKNTSKGKVIFSKSKARYAIESKSKGIFSDINIGDKIIF